MSVLCHHLHKKNNEPDATIVTMVTTVAMVSGHILTALWYNNYTLSQGASEMEERERDWKVSLLTVQWMQQSQQHM